MMIRKLLATTALASVIATGAFAQSETTTPAAAPTDSPATEAPAATGTMDSTDTAANAAAPSGDYLQSIGTDQYLASDLTGGEVFASAAADAEASGEIENFLVNNDGKIAAAIVTTDGLEEDKTVAVPFEKITWSMDAENEPRAVLTATPEELAAAPVFTETTAADAAETGAAAPAAAPAATDSSAAAPAAPAATDTPAATAAADGVAEPMTSDAMSTSEFAATVGADQYLSQSIIGSGVYGGPAADAESVGSINDLVLSSEGQVAAAVVGVGGFLGIGEKNVGVPFAELQMLRGDGTEPRIVLAATKEQLTAAPTFETEPEDVASNSATSTGAATGASDTADSAADTTTAANDAATTTGNAADQAGDTASNVGAAATGAATGAAAGAAATTGAAADSTTTASTGGAVDRASLTPVTGPELTAENLDGTTVYGPNDASIGEVGDIALSADGAVDAIIVDVGGFLGIGQKQVAVAMDNLQFMKDADGSMYLYTQFTQDQLQNAPEYNTDTYTQNRDTMRLQSSGDAPAAGTTAN